MADVELLPLEGAKSAVWQYFGFPAKDGKYIEPDKGNHMTTNCRLCTKVVKYSGNTTNMRVHLREAHQSLYNAMLLSEKQSAPSTLRESNQPTVVEALKRNESIPKTSAWWNQITEAVWFFIARDMQPFDTVNDPGFRHLLHELEPRYLPPDHKTIATKYIPCLFDREKEHICQQMCNVMTQLIYGLLVPSMHIHLSQFTTLIAALCFRATCLK